VPIVALLRLAADAREDAEPAQQGLHAADEIFTDHVEPDEGRSLPLGDIAVRLEQAAQVGRNDRQRVREQPLGNPLVDATRAQVPCGDEVGQDVSVQPSTPAVQIGALSAHEPLVPVHVREYDIEGLRHPGQFGIGDRHRFDRQ